MTKYILIICMLFASIYGCMRGQLDITPVSIVPRPVQAVPGEGNPHLLRPNLVFGREP